jgi:hypothetical protein
VRHTAAGSSLACKKYKWVEVTNILAYYNTYLIAALESFIRQTPDFNLTESYEFRQNILYICPRLELREFGFKIKLNNSCSVFNRVSSN